jgi:DNA-binding response OmpR family regulator
MKSSRLPHVMVVDDEVFIRNALQIYFESCGFHVSVAGDGEKALQILSESVYAVDVIILDRVLPEVDGLEVLKSMKRLDPDVEVIIATGFGSINTAVDALRLGAFDYVTKPIVDFDVDLLQRVNAALESRRKRAGSRRTSPPGGAAGARARESLHERLNELAALQGRRASLEQLLAQIGEVLARDFGASGAALLEEDAEHGWACLHSWGSGPESGDEGKPVRPGAGSDFVAVHVPLDGPGAAPSLLHLYYPRESSALRTEESPLALLAAVLSYVLRGVPGGVKKRAAAGVPA